ncbi:MAG TPA: Calx-beta domain-containing protein, partial [Conexibacter sp.]|nr:Calx-beta domain-containing protein [Conexibacter sp.]
VALELSEEVAAGVEFARDRATGVIANSAMTRQIDGDAACNGGLFDIIVLDRLPNPRCLSGSDNFLSVAAGSPTADPAAGVASFELTRPIGHGRTWVHWETVDGSARAGVDYVAASGTALLSGQQQRVRVAVPLLDPAGADGDRSFTLRLSDGHAGQSLTTTDGTATIAGAVPALAGTPRVGVELTGAAPGAATRQWQRCDALGACWEIAGATGAGYTPTAADLGFGLRVRATHALGGDPAAARMTAFTPTSAAVLPALPRPGPDPIPPADPRPLPTTDSQPSTRPRPTVEPAPQPGPAQPQPQPDPGAQPAPGATLVVRGRREQNRSVALVAAGRANLWMRCSVACRIDAPLTISKAAARALGLRSTTIGRARGRAAAGELVRLRVTLNGRAKVRVLSTRGRLRVVATIATPGGRAVRVSFGLNPVRTRT